jgi:predicted protein tyrosine phosphatase
MTYFYIKSRGMASSKQCSTCQKYMASMYCIGCDAYFCAKDFRGHREILFNEMDGIMGERNELQEQINTVGQQNDTNSPLIGQINDWEKITIEKVKKTAKHAREQASQLLNSKRVKITNEFKSFSQELVDLKESENFVEHDLTRLQQMVRQFDQDLKQLKQPVSVELSTEQSDQTNWDRLIYVQEKRTSNKKKQQQQEAPPPGNCSLANCELCQ